MVLAGAIVANPKNPATVAVFDLEYDRRSDPAEHELTLLFLPVSLLLGFLSLLIWEGKSVEMPIVIGFSSVPWPRWALFREFSLYFSLF
jgi:hypothetical protein